MRRARVLGGGARAGLAVVDVRAHADDREAREHADVDLAQIAAVDEQRVSVRALEVLLVEGPQRDQALDLLEADDVGVALPAPGEGLGGELALVVVDS